MPRTHDRFGLPRFPVHLTAPDIRPWLPGNVLPGVWSFAAAVPGPHVVVQALTHGNEIGGAVLLDRWLQQGLRPKAGRISLVFANTAAYARFDPAEPITSRCVDEDLNRVWSPTLLDGPRRSWELDRARELRPLIDSADVVLDLHSMLWPSEPLFLSGLSQRSRHLAVQIGVPPLVIADRGHETGLRLIDSPAFAAADGRRIALLLEAGQHWEEETVAVMAAATGRLLQITGVADAPAEPPPSQRPATPPRFARVTATVTAQTPGFAFVQAYRGGDIIPRRNTLIALDGEHEVRTPHDHCLLVMPSPRTLRGHTAVRLARFEAP